MYLNNDKGKSVVAERFIKTLKNKIYKYMTSISKKAYIDKLDDTLHKYNNIYQRIVTVKPIGLKLSTYVDSSKVINDEDLKIKIGDIVRISKYKNIFAKGYVPNWFVEVFVIKKIKNTVPWTYGISDQKGE